MRRFPTWHELMVIFILGPLIGLGIGLGAQKAAPFLADVGAPAAHLSRD